MRRAPTPFKTMLASVLLVAAAPVHARSMTVEVDAVRAEAASMSGVRARLDWPDGARAGQLELRVGRLDFPALAYRATDVVWRCPLQGDGAGPWTCEGPARAAGSGERRLALTIAPAGTRAELSGGGTRISYESLAASPDFSRVDLTQVPVAWLEAYLASLWADGRWTGGTLDGRVDVDAAGAGLAIDADLDLRDVSLETPDGTTAAAGIAGALKLDVRTLGERTAIGARLTTRGGEFLVDSLYVQLPDTPVDIAVDMASQPGGGWHLPRIAWRDGDVLVADGEATLGTDAAVRDLRLDLRVGDLAVARDRYLSGFLAPSGFGDVVLSGAASGRVRLQDGVLRELALSPRGVTAIDPKQRFTLAGLGGDLAWRADGAGSAGALHWDSGALFGIGLGAATLPFANEGGALTLATPARVDVLGGSVALDRLRWQPPGDGHGTRFELGVTMDRLDLGSLSQRLGWPDFAGTLGGRIPSARFENNVLTLDGGLVFEVFGGTVALSQLAMERPFGVAPSLTADVAIDGIDLEPLTAAFDFGTITGRLDGRIAAIRMVDWEFVAFDAWLATDEAWKGRQRISQRAVQDISNIGGGGGLGAGLQAQALKLFEDFGYRRIGLGCRLRGEVCEMSGLDSGGDSYTIVQGAGLPRLTVIGHRRLVDWPTLVERLQAATSGTKPIID
jgi:hypothetical protein